MRNAAVLAILCSLFLAVSGCTVLDPALVKALSEDDASFCVSSDIRGGVAGAMTGATGGYGQGTLNLCRSKMPNAKIELKPDGSISIEHSN